MADRLAPTMAGAPPQVEHNVWEGGPVAWILVPAAVQQRSVGCQPLWGWGIARQPLRWRHLQPAALDDPTGLLQAGQGARQAGSSGWAVQHLAAQAPTQIPAHKIRAGLLPRIGAPARG
jgi:hypothetical protein